MVKNKPITLMLLGILEILLGIVGTLMSMLSFLIAKERTSILIFSLAIVFLVALFLLISGILILKLKSLGRINSIATSLIILLVAILPKGNMDIMKIAVNAGVVILCLLVVFYLTRPKVKNEFKK